ncbi:hypothetical protein IAR50_006085 [Cryptococcus sp. DSM 104548]
MKAARYSASSHVHSVEWFDKGDKGSRREVEFYLRGVDQMGSKIRAWFNKESDSINAQMIETALAKKVENWNMMELVPLACPYRKDGIDMIV